jgi:ferredoxin-NADP reductase
VLIGGLLIVRKIRQEDMMIRFCAAVLVSVCVYSIVQRQDIFAEIRQLFVQSPLFFFAFIMLTEPLTAPPTKNLRRLYSMLTGVLFLPQLHLGSIYATPELALVIGNAFAYIVSPKQKVVLKLKRKIRVASNIVDFVFKPSQKFAFQPGQYMELTLAHLQTDSRGNRRYFTLASSPTENDVLLGVRFYERSSSFKKALYKLSNRTQLVAAQIAGDFTLPPNSQQKLVFLAGGIGITPFRSMIKYLLDTQQRRDILLIYVNKTADEIVYTDVFNDAANKLGIRTYYTLTDASTLPRNWDGFVGRIDEPMLLKTVPDYSERTFYISGPSEMVKASERVLHVLGVSNAQIKKDFFPGLV